jgi:crossover junction endodeoxyribonuclease RuvC
VVPPEGDLCLRRLLAGGVVAGLRGVGGALRVLALDIATNVGWAVGDGTPRGTHCDTRRLTGTSDLGRMSHHFGIFLADQITTWEPDLIAIERGFFRGPMSYHLSGLIWDAHRIGYVRGVPRVEFPPSTIKKFICGSGKASKDDVQIEVIRRGFYPVNDHESDAIALLLLALDRAQTKVAA